MRAALAMLAVFTALFTGWWMASSSPAQEQTAKSLVENMLENLLATEGRSVSIEGLSISLQGDVNVSRVEVREADSPWLVLEGLTLDWQPLSLLRSTLEINSINVDSVDVRRLPQTEEGGVSSPTQMSNLSNANVNRLSIGRLRLDAAVVGQETLLKVDGSARVVQSPAEIILSFLAERTDGKAGQLKADVSLDPRSRQLKVSMELNEQADGLLVEQLGLRGDPAVRLVLDATGTISDWRGTLALDLNQERVLEGNAQMASTEGGQRLTLDASGQVERLAPPSFSRVLRGQSQLVGTIVLPAEGGLADIQRLWIDNDAYQLRIAGPVDWAGTGSNVSIELRPKSDEERIPLPELKELGEAEIVGLSGNAGFTGAALNPRWTLAADVKAIETGVVVIREVVLGLQGSGVTPQNDTVRVKGDVRGRVEQGARAVLPPAVIGLASASIEAELGQSGSVSLRSAAVSAGSIVISGSGQIEPETGRFDLNVNGSADSPVTGIAAIDPLLEGAIKANGRVTQDGQGKYSLEQFIIEGPGFATRIGGAVSLVDLNVSGTLRLADLQRLDTRIEGAADGSFTLKGPWEAPQAQVSAQGAQIRLLDRELNGAQLKWQGVLSTATPAGSLAMTGTLDGKPVSLDARVETDAKGTRFLRQLSFRSNTSTLTGEFSLPQSGVPTGRLQLSSPDLRDVGPLLLTEMAGQLDAAIELTDAVAGGRISVAFNGTNLAANDLRAKSAEGQFTVDEPYSLPKPEGRIALTGARLAGLSFDKLDAIARAVSQNAYEIAIQAAGKDVSGRSKVELTINGSDLRLDVSEFNGTLRGVPVRSASPISIRRTGDIWSVGNAVIGLGEGRAIVDGRIAPTLDATLRVERVSVSPLEPLIGIWGLTGRLTGGTTLKGEMQSPSGQFNLRGEGVSVAALAAQGIGPLTFDSNGSFKDRALTFSADGNAGTGTSLTVEGTVDFKSATRLDLRLTGETDGRWITERLADSGARFSADTRFDVRVTGTSASPQFNGTADVQNAAFGDAAGRFLVRSAGGRLVLRDTVLQVSSLKGVTGRNGTAVFNGTVALNEPFNADLTGKIENGVYTDGSFVTTRYDADLKLTGALFGTPVLSGEIGLRKAKITLSSLPPQALTAPDVKHRKAPAAVRKQAQLLAELRKRGGGDIQLDIVLRAQDPISVSGRGLSVTLGGSLRLTGTLDDIAAQGAFRLQRGSLKLLARRLDFESGRLDFEDGLDPRINFVAVSRRTDATITLTISGRASSPDIRITSSPQLPEEEAMARLMFDRSMLQLSPLQIAQIASYVATLSGGRDTGLLTGLQNALGADWFDIIQTETGETAVSVGRRINERLSVGVEQTTKSNTSRVTIDLGVSKNLKVRGSYDTDGNSRAGVYYEKDY